MKCLEPSQHLNISATNEHRVNCIQSLVVVGLLKTYLKGATGLGIDLQKLLNLLADISQKEQISIKFAQTQIIPSGNGL